MAGWPVWSTLNLARPGPRPFKGRAEADHPRTVLSRVRPGHASKIQGRWAGGAGLECLGGAKRLGELDDGGVKRLGM